MIYFIEGVVFLLLVNGAHSQVTNAGTCPNLSGMRNFDFQRYQGVWYEVEKYFFLPEITGTCVYVRYKNFHPEDLTFNADIVQVEAFTRKHIVSPSNGRIISEDGSAQIDLNVNVILPLSPFLKVRVNYPYYILDTDYETYSIKWSCRQLGAFNSQSIWILSKSRNYPADLRRQVWEKIRGFGLRPQFLKLTDQNNCPMPRDTDDANVGSDDSVMD